ncbi:MAG TPA: glycoside hydrolase family protein [Crinalium sp.]
MSSEPRDRVPPSSAKSGSPKSNKTPGAFDWLIAASGLTAVAMIAMGQPFGFLTGRSPYNPDWNYTPAPLVMNGGDPYIRALMRTISASESSDAQPYSVLYGGEHVQDLSHHPDRCVPIQTGPNLGDCTTAAGRYQFITSTWLEKARLYHPKPERLLFWEAYSFKPEFQDEVVYAWLDDPNAWGVDLAELLRDGQVTEVLQILSPVWTSLSSDALEPNSVTNDLPAIYQQMLDEELKLSN